MTQRKPLVVANWKLNGNAELANVFCEALTKYTLKHDGENVELVICPPALYVRDFSGITNVSIGAQDVSKHLAGAYTGELSASMLKNSGVSFVIIGHSECRQYHADSDQDVAEKFARVIEEDMTPILCIGESLQTREQGSLFEFVRTQLDVVVAMNGIDSFANAVIAYEPIWAIGTGVTATKEQAQEVHEFIRQYLAEKSPQVAEQCLILYGGSVNEKNAEELFSQSDIDGGLVGGASLKPESFLAIGAAAAR